MSITKKDVEHVAMLARIELTEEEKERFTKDFNDILGFVNKLNELDTENVPPTAHVLDLQNVFREDVVAPSLEREKALENAPEQKDGLFSVPKII